MVVNGNMTIGSMAISSIMSMNDGMSINIIPSINNSKSTNSVISISNNISINNYVSTKDSMSVSSSALITSVSTSSMPISSMLKSNG